MMADPLSGAQSIEGALSVVEADGRDRLFVLSLSEKITREHAEFIRETWRKLGFDAFGRVIVLDNRCTLTCLTDDALRDLGLVRLPGGEA